MPRHSLSSLEKVGLSMWSDQLVEKLREEFATGSWASSKPQSATILSLLIHDFELNQTSRGIKLPELDEAPEFQQEFSKPDALMKLVTIARNNNLPVPPAATQYDMSMVMERVISYYRKDKKRARKVVKRYTVERFKKDRENVAFDVPENIWSHFSQSDNDKDDVRAKMIQHVGLWCNTNRAKFEKALQGLYEKIVETRRMMRTEAAPTFVILPIGIAAKTLIDGAASGAFPNDDELQRDLEPLLITLLNERPGNHHGHR